MKGEKFQNNRVKCSTIHCGDRLTRLAPLATVCTSFFNAICRNGGTGLSKINLWEMAM